MRTARTAGAGMWTDRESGKEAKARDTIKCNHCQHFMFVEPKQDAATLGGFCRTCMGFMCPRCTHKREVGLEACVTFMAKIEQSEARDRLRRQLYGDYR